MRISRVVIGASLLAAGVALGAYHRRVPRLQPAANLGPSAPIIDSADLSRSHSGNSNASATSAPAAEPLASANIPVRVEIKNVDFHFTDNIVVHIASLEGKLVSDPGTIPVFDDKRSFQVDASSADVTITARVLTNDMNDFVFAKPDSPLRDLAVTTKGNEMIIKGRLSSKGDLPFESDGIPVVTPDGMLRIHAVKMKAVHVPVKSLMDSLGLHTSSVLNTKNVDGVTVDHDDLIFDPSKILPPPSIHGRLTSAEVRGNTLALKFGTPDGEHADVAPIAPACAGRNFLVFKGGTIRFGRLTMTDADLELLDSTPADPFDFSMDRYREQLASGFSKTMNNGGLCVHMPDLDKINASTSVADTSVSGKGD